MARRANSPPARSDTCAAQQFAQQLISKNGSRIYEAILSASAQARGGYPGGSPAGQGIPINGKCSFERSAELLPHATPMTRWRRRRTEVGELAQLRSGVRVAAPAFGFAGGFW